MPACAGISAGVLFNENNVEGNVLQRELLADTFAEGQCPVVGFVDAAELNAEFLFTNSG